MTENSPQQHSIVQTDNFPVLPVESWYFDKLGIVQSYLKAWHSRIDLRNKPKILLYIGSGPGFVQTNDGQQALQGTPLSILAGPYDFQRYIFCEENSDYAAALKVRIGKFYPHKHTLIVEGDINQTIEKLPPYLPDKIGRSTTAILCLVDVQSFDVEFETMQLLAEMGVDLLLVNSYRHSEYYNYKFYLEEERETLNAYFGSAWARLAESSELVSDTSFFMLVVKAYLEQMRHLGYKVTATLHKYRQPDIPVPYYQIAYCTQSRGLNAVKKKMAEETGKQINLFE